MLSISMHMQNLVKIHLFILRLLGENDILNLFKGHNSVLNWRKLTINNPKLDVVNINAYANFGQNPSEFSQDIERKRKCYGRTTSKQYTPPPTSYAGV